MIRFWIYLGGRVVLADKMAMESNRKRGVMMTPRFLAQVDGVYIYRKAEMGNELIGGVCKVTRKIASPKHSSEYQAYISN